MTQTKVADFEVIDHGIEGSQYFQGCGVAFSKFSDVVTGCGNDFAEAFDDALESLAQNGLDAEDLEDRERADRTDWTGDGPVPEDAEDVYYYVSIRYNVGV